LKELAELNIQFKHLKKTGISIVVAKLRNHANDKVSINAKNLRDKWKKMVPVDNGNGHPSDSPAPSSGTPDTKDAQVRAKLEKMTRLLQRKEDDEKLHESQLSTIKKLFDMKLRAAQVIDSHIGVAISKLRKSR
jgi:hypothetical protein